ncbi:MAG: hypothetical protein EOP43_08255 [Sphingobacteriaceae bacterium]|nr:MAG: hypothetical protein EOP43_08255 [Sphingobacteriaceae bacterium]
MISLKTYGQLQQIFQGVNIEKYQGKNFILEGKILYKDKITRDSWLVLATVSIDNKKTPIKASLYNDNALDYYKQDDWSSYELAGKIDKNASYFAIGVAIAGNGSYYLDNFKHQTHL